MTRPCRPCDQQKVTMTRREWIALEVAAKAGRELRGLLSDARLELQTLRRELETLKAAGQNK